jgi:cysteinyl-tRNA synthetase
MALREIQSRFGVETLDLHAGGVDLIFPHHENEIAQSEGATGQPFVRYWLHGEFLTVEGTKMSKRFGNILTARDLQEEGVDAAAVRMLIFSTHYRKQLAFSDRALKSSSEGILGLQGFRERLSRVASGSTPDAAAGASLDTEFRAAMDDDLNAPQAVAAVFSFVRRVNRELDTGGSPAFAAGALAAFDRVMEVLDLMPSAAAVDDELLAWVEERIAARQQARRSGDYQKADVIRAELAARGIEIEDTPSGTRWKRRAA